MAGEISILVAAGGVFGAILVSSLITFWLMQRAGARRQDSQQALLLQSDRQLNEVQQTLTASQQAVTALQIEQASSAERLIAREAKIEELEARLVGLDETLMSERKHLIQLRDEISRLQTSLTEQQQQSEEKLLLLKEAKDSMTDGFKNLANDIFEAKHKEFKTQSKEQLNGVLDPLHERIKAFEKRVEQTYSDEAKERFSLVKEVKSLQELNTRIAQDAVNLTNALKGENKTQGVWGEMVLERVLENSGLKKGSEYEVQVALKQEDGKRLQPDVIIRLPEGKDVVVDSKVSLTAYERYCSADTELEQQAALKAHTQSIRAHIKSLSAKDYQTLQGIRTLDYVLLFVPIESAFSVAIQSDETLYTDALEHHIAIVTPATLLATLRTIQNMWRVDQQNKNAEEIAHRAGKLYDKFVSFVADLELIGSRLDSVQGAYRDAHNKLSSGRGNLVKRAEDMKLLGAKVSKSLPQNLVEMPDVEVIAPVTSVDKS